MPPHLVHANLHLADRSYVVAAMASFAGKPADQWLLPAHPFSKGQVAQRSWTALATVPNARFIEAVAVAGPTTASTGGAMFHVRYRLCSLGISMRLGIWPTMLNSEQGCAC